MPRSVALLAGGAGLLLVAGVVLALLAPRRAETSFPPGSPEATVACYLRLLQDGQVDQAAALVDFDGPRPLTSEQFHQQYDQWSRNTHRVTLLHSETSGEQASVRVEIATFSPGAFGAEDRTAQATFTLVRRDGAWRINDPPFLYG